MRAKSNIPDNSEIENRLEIACAIINGTIDRIRNAIPQARETLSPLKSMMFDGIRDLKVIKKLRVYFKSKDGVIFRMFEFSIDWDKYEWNVNTFDNKYILIRKSNREREKRSRVKNGGLSYQDIESEFTQQVEIFLDFVIKDCLKVSLDVDCCNWTVELRELFSDNGIEEESSSENLWREYDSMKDIEKEQNHGRMNLATLLKSVYNLTTIPEEEWKKILEFDGEYDGTLTVGIINELRVRYIADVEY